MWDPLWVEFESDSSTRALARSISIDIATLTSTRGLAPALAEACAIVLMIMADRQRWPTYGSASRQLSRILSSKLSCSILASVLRMHASFIRKWLDNCVPKSAAAQGDLDSEDAGAAALEGA